MRFATISAALAALLVLTSEPMARTWQILPDGTGDAPTIQAGIDSSANGDTVSLGNGTFTGEGNQDVTFRGLAVVVRSNSEDPVLCVVDCEDPGGGFHRGFLFITSEGSGSILEHVSIINAFATPRGGAIRCVGSSPTIRGCVLKWNRSVAGGALALENGSAPTVEDCWFIENSATYAGGAVLCINSGAAQFTRCEFIDNQAVSIGGAGVIQGSNPGFTGCLIEGNTAYGGGGLYCYSEARIHIVNCDVRDNHATGGDGGGLVCAATDLAIEGCTFYGNTTAVAGGAIAISTGVPILRNLTLVGNSAYRGGGISIAWVDPIIEIENVVIAHSGSGGAISCTSSPSPDVRCSNLFGNTGGDWSGCVAGQNGVNGNVSTDPLFCDATAGDFTLHSNSPCAPGNHPDGAACGLIGALGVGCGPTTATEQTSLGEIKSLFR